PAFRCFVSFDSDLSGFGYTHTATHLRMEGLLLGFLAAYLPSYLSPVIAWLKERSGSLRAFSLFAFSVFILLPSVWVYIVGLTILSFGLVSILLWSVGKEPGPIASCRIVHWVAVTSYSVYLTHALIIHLARRAIDLLPVVLWPIYFPVSLLL